MAEQGKKRSKKGGCVLGCLGLPLATLIGVWVTFSINNRPPNIFIPPPMPPPLNNAFDEFVAAGDMAKKLVNQAPASMRNPPTGLNGTRAAADTCAKESAPILARVRAALDQPCLAPPSRSFNTLFPQYAKLREMARTLSASELSHELHGRYAEAAQVCLDSGEASVMIAKGGNLIPGLVSIACEAISFRRFEELIPHLSPAELANADIRLAKIQSKRVGWDEIMLEEGYASVAGLQEVLRDPKSQGIGSQIDVARSYLGIEDDKRPNYKETVQIVKYTLGNKEQMLRELFRYYQEAAKEAKDPYTGIMKTKAPDSLLGEMLAIGNQGREKWIAQGAVYKLYRLEIALYRYKADRGSFPAGLSELTPKYLQTIPDDPCGGRANVPFTYKLLPNGQSFLLYGRGPDLKDDGGTPGRFPGDSNPSDMVAGKLYPKPKWAH